MTDFEKIHGDSSAQDVVVLALDVDEPPETVAPYVDKAKLTFPVLLGKDTDVVSSYGVYAYPTTFAIDKNGAVSGILVGGNGARLRAAIATARAGGPQPVSKIAPATSTSERPSTTPATADDLYRDAIRQRNKQDYAGAIDSLNRALELRPDWLQAVLALGSNHFDLKEFGLAIEAYTRAIELDPKRSASYDSRGRAYSNSGRHPQAIPDYTRAIELNPDNGSAYNNRGWAYLETGHLDEALADLNKAIELTPTNSVALFNRAHLYERRRDYAKAIADFDSILRASPANSVAASQKAADLRRLDGLPPVPVPAPVAGIREVSPGEKIHCQGRLDIPQTFEWNLDSCQLDISPTGDFWFESVDRQTRFISPKGAAQLAVMGDKPAGYAGCSAAKFTAERINVASLKKGTYVCVQTNQGRIAEFSFDDLYAKVPSSAFVLTLAISFKTWER
jgi:tetratricopeptide (TPR) repeat protein